MTRSAIVEKFTKDTSVQVSLSLNGGPLDLLPEHDTKSYDPYPCEIFQLEFEIDDHHTAQDTFLAIGEVFSKALGNRKGIKRFRDAHVPHDESLARAVIDISSRPYFSGKLNFKDSKIGNLTTQMIPHCLQSFSQTAGVTLYIDVLKGDNDHRAEASF
ncbi:Imidazoleglycerol-phosphate dehydratase-domain-containing protein [Podospora fimiseda]|uniref:Imidazoleglycerol-phosphate dehydratase-domain-containing protein n=1 Tax=Podospora fimiseda TaxID=252190 RepID=A0AAN7H405_9PEZI|nr:Imidazoleglycerol-phosphate dehydratase-domain-containing protein [Podospora fimiseda]